MKLTSAQLRSIIKEEVQNVVSERLGMSPAMKQKRDVDYDLKRALIFAGVLNDNHDPRSYKIIDWFTSNYDYSSAQTMMEEYNEQHEVSLTLDQIKSIRVAMAKDIKRAEKRSSYEF